MNQEVLKLNNYVYELINKSNKQIVKIKGVSKYSISWHPSRNTGHHATIEPIQLNEKWFKNLEFIRTFHGFYKEPLIIRMNEKIDYYYDIDEKLGFNIKIEFVHQLQNLYFALTGEELELKSESKP